MHLHTSFNFPRLFSVLSLLLCQVSFAGSELDPADAVFQEIYELPESPYSDIDFCGHDDPEDDAIPENVVETLYGNARMAFMFGQYEVAFKAWKPLAEDGYAKAQASLAWMYHTGNGVKKNMPTAFSWYLKAADQGHAIAQNNLAVMYEAGIGTPVNQNAAAYWYLESANSGYSFAQYNTGRIFSEGHGVKQNKEEAIYWWRIASRQGVKEAKEALALLENRPAPAKSHNSPAIAHAPYHSKPVAKGLAWIKNQQRGHYTIQLARSKDAAWILKLAASEQLEQPVVQFKTKDKNGEEWINLIYGTFSSYQSAEASRKALPTSLRKGSPWLRRFGEINAILLKNSSSETPAPRA
jgi:TPR repeat protein